MSDELLVIRRADLEALRDSLADRALYTGEGADHDNRRMADAILDAMPEGPSTDSGWIDAGVHQSACDLDIGDAGEWVIDGIEVPGPHGWRVMVKPEEDTLKAERQTPDPAADLPGAERNEPHWPTVAATLREVGLCMDEQDFDAGTLFERADEIVERQAILKARKDG